MVRKATLNDIQASITDLQATTRNLQATTKDLQATTKDILEIVAHIKDNAVTKEELKTELTDLRAEFKSDLAYTKYELREEIKNLATKDELKQIKNEIIEVIDPIINKHNTFELELMAQRSRTERLESRVDALEK